MAATGHVSSSNKALIIAQTEADGRIHHLVRSAAASCGRQAAGRDALPAPFPGTFPESDVWPDRAVPAQHDWQFLQPRADGVRCSRSLLTAAIPLSGGRRRYL